MLLHIAAQDFSQHSLNIFSQYTTAILPAILHHYIPLIIHLPHHHYTPQYICYTLCRHTSPSSLTTLFKLPALITSHSSLHTPSPYSNILPGKPPHNIPHNTLSNISSPYPLTHHSILQHTTRQISH